MSVHRQYILRVQPTRCNISQFIYFCKMLYVFQTVFPSIIRSSKLHIQCQVFVRPILLPAASLTRMELQQAAGSSIGLTNTWHCMCSFEPLMMDEKRCLKHVEHLTEINKLRNIVSCWLYSANLWEIFGLSTAFATGALSHIVACIHHKFVICSSVYLIWYRSLSCQLLSCPCTFWSISQDTAELFVLNICFKVM